MNQRVIQEENHCRKQQ